MRKPLRTVLVVFVISLLAELAWLSLRPGAPEPVLQGKPVGVWINDLASLVANGPAVTNWQRLGPVAVPILIKALGKRGYPGHTLYRTIWPRLPPFFRRRFAQPVDCASIRSNAALLLGVLPCDITPAIPALVRAIDDDAPAVRMNAANPLGKIGETHREVLPVLLRALRNKDRYVRSNIVASLGRFQTPADAVPHLLKALEDPDALVRVRAVTSLRRIAPETEAKLDTVTVLLGCANDSYPWACSRAITALGESGNRARAAVPMLLAFLADRDAGTRRAATNAFRQLDPEAAAKAGIK